MLQSEVLFETVPRNLKLAEGAMLLEGFARHAAVALLAELDRIAEISAFRHMVTPGGHRMSVAMTNCGSVGWISDHRGYRYATEDPQTGRCWPDMPAPFADLAMRAAERCGFGGFVPDACLINRYAPGTRLTLHQDRNERVFDAPIVSVSVGLPAIFLFGGAQRSDRTRRIALFHGDVVVWGGPARRAFHGVAKLADGEHPLLGRARINLTFRRAL